MKDTEKYLLILYGYWLSYGFFTAIIDYRVDIFINFLMANIIALIYVRWLQK